MTEQPKWQKLALMILSALLAVSFVGAGMFKLIAFSAAAEQFQLFGYPPWFVLVTAAVELTSAVLVAIPRTRYWGALMLMFTMIGAIISHLKAEEPGETIPPLVLMVMAILVVWYSHPHHPEPGKGPFGTP